MRLYVPLPLSTGAEWPLPDGPARHAMVRRVQPGDHLTLFDGSGSDWDATVLAVTRRDVQVRVGAATAVHRELPIAVTLAAVMPANERMDVLVEKATELGVSRIQPLHSERSVLRLSGERAVRKQAHWQAVAQAACEQCGRAVVPQVAPVLALTDWLAGLHNRAHIGSHIGSHTSPHSSLHTGPHSAPHTRPNTGARWLLSLGTGAQAPMNLPRPQQALCTLSGPEGGFTADEEAAALAAGFVPTDLGPRVLRAETAPLAVLAWLGLSLPIPGHG